MDNLLDKNKIIALLPHAMKVQMELLVYQSVTSTQDVLKVQAQNPSTRICLAEMQTKGRGRFDRPWFSPFGKNIYLSCRTMMNKNIADLSGLSLVVSLSIIDALKTFGVSDVSLKWPNDVIYQGKKLAGTLIEAIPKHANCIVVIGIGLNAVNDVDAPANAIAVEQLLQKKIHRNELAAALIISLYNYLQTFAEFDFAYFSPQWQQVDYLFNRNIILKTAQGEVSGRALGINKEGHLNLELTDGRIASFAEGEASVKLPGKKC